MASYKFPKDFCLFCDMGHAPVTDGNSRFHVLQVNVYDADDNVNVHQQRAACLAQDKDQ